MKRKPDYIIEQPEGEGVSLLFNSYMFKEYCDKKGIELEDLYQSIQTGSGFRVKELPVLLLCAAETYALYNDIDVKYSAIDAADWVDTIGGFNSPKILDIYQLFVCKLINADPAQFKLLWNQVTQGEEKKRPESTKKKKANA